MTEVLPVLRKDGVALDVGDRAAPIERGGQRVRTLGRLRVEGDAVEGLLKQRAVEGHDVDDRGERDGRGDLA